MTRRSFPTRQSRPIVMILKISVVIPTLNEASVLRSTLRKVGAHQPHEIIVADGGSVDETLSIEQFYINNDSLKGYQFSCHH